MARLISLNVGLPRNIPWQGRVVSTAIWKYPVNGPRMVRRLNIDGDGQGDLAGHGGPNRAVYLYQIESYRYWERFLDRNDFVHGQFGENFTVEGLSDAETFVGDRFRIGGGLFEVSQPRVTCYRLGIRMGVPEMAALLVSHDRPGFYLRVLEEGLVEAGDEIIKVASGHEGMTISEIDALLYKPDHPRERLELAIENPALSVGWRRSFEELLHQASGDAQLTGNAGLIAMPQAAPAWAGFREFRVYSKTKQSSDVVSLDLEPTDGRPIGESLPGQFIVLELKPDSSSKLLRSYSLSSVPKGTRYRVSIKREFKGRASRYVHDELRVGDPVRVSAPRGSFTLSEGDNPIVLVSAGIGITPMLAMLEALAARKAGREVWWLYGAHNGRQDPFGAEVRQLLSSLPRARSFICYSSPDSADSKGRDYDLQSRLNTTVLQSLFLPKDGEFYLCGPSAFMSDIAATLGRLGVASAHVHTETFGAGKSVTPGIAESEGRRPHEPEGVTGTGPMISFARSGLNVRWSSAFANLLEFAEACDVPVRWSCRTGVCHTCETAIISGGVSYRPAPLDKAAEGNVLVCCSQPTMDTVIDL
ncbi:MOSC domain-containing protein [Rhizobium ruizarguesonis]|uniref:MOSC and FAD-binding oxidoreductase domain-containing protein n=1 Tax=Rhizobium ruizarguesonis TaxID=2081791 RepID=UPI0010313365|nr:MOSC and FAD-binding oxidoreductase domain-containing protein [Rhizobium ruizarguesonis]TAV98410.1 MOSC domain-containing protein [Rhizobium ruizarguesonis]TBC98745.1 MOSC domain-containing protein [Rhizobium ruizarguesonis]TBD15582.1 MOSC domain-containing protein [Rhizobium ruizarguesonis]TBE96638.1 MOSC domain-containing protein [Rhizobium ruizarguesonis]